jgi:hypothetical protein
LVQGIVSRNLNLLVIVLQMDEPEGIQLAPIIDGTGVG